MPSKTTLNWLFNDIWCYLFIACFHWKIGVARVYYILNLIIFLFFGPASTRSYKIGVVGDNWLVGNAIFSETAPRIFLIFCMKFGDYEGRKVTEPDFWKKILIWRCLRKGLQISVVWLVGWLVGNTVFSETAIRMFLIFCMKFGYYKGRSHRARYLKKIDLEMFTKRCPN